MLSESVIVPATYTASAVKRYRGNPFIEALPPLPSTRIEFATMVENRPEPPTAEDRKKGEIDRLLELQTVNDLVYPFPDYQKIALSLATMLPETYVARNPLSVIDVQRRHAVAAGERDGIPFPANWKSSAKGHLFIAISGMGKSTLAAGFFLRYPQLIQHTSYQGKPFKHVQLVYLMLRVPHDASLKALCIQFFEEVDRLLGTNYTRQARGVRQIGLMVQLMNQVATAVSLGFIVIDEVQNLKSARGGNADFVLNLFSDIIEKLGISILVIATPAVQSVIAPSVRNGRKLASAGSTTIEPMKKDSLLWEEFCNVVWEYTYVKQKGPCTPEIKNAWHFYSGGNTAFALLLFVLAQKREIGGREVIDKVAFERIAMTDMAFLEPAIRALRTRKASHLAQFDDLVFDKKYLQLRKSLGVIEDLETPKDNEEFDDVQEQSKSERKPAGKRKAQKKTRRPDESAGAETDIPMEDPLVM